MASTADFTKTVSVDTLNKMSVNTLAENLGIMFTDIGEDWMTAKMPVDHRTHQPYGLLHGGASVALAETMGSIAAHCSIDSTKYYCVGLEINANHLKGVRNGFVYGTVKPIHRGRSTQVWEIRIVNEQKELVCVSRITIAVLSK